MGVICIIENNADDAHGVTNGDHIKISAKIIQTAE